MKQVSTGNYFNKSMLDFSMAGINFGPPITQPTLDALPPPPTRSDTYPTPPGSHFGQDLMPNQTRMTTTNEEVRSFPWPLDSGYNRNQGSMHSSTSNPPSIASPEYTDHHTSLGLDNQSTKYIVPVMQTTNILSREWNSDNRFRSYDSRQASREKHEYHGQTPPAVP
jgi:hypothetical protein